MNHFSGEPFPGKRRWSVNEPQAIDPNLGSLHPRFALSNTQDLDNIIELSARRSHHLDWDHRWQTIVCLKGRIWITQEKDFQDYVLEQDETFIITNIGRVVIQALEDSTIAVTPRLGRPKFAGSIDRTVFQ
jgi:hypothetical protein